MDTNLGTAKLEHSHGGSSVKTTTSRTTKIDPRCIEGLKGTIHEVLSETNKDLEMILLITRIQHPKAISIFKIYKIKFVKS